MITIDERVKHRIVGIAVILSIAAMFLPALLKHAQQPFDHLSRVAVRLPKKPVIEASKIKDEAAVFQAVKVSEVQVKPAPTQPSIRPAPPVFEEEPIAQTPSVVPKAPETVKVTPPKPLPPIVVVKHQPNVVHPATLNYAYSIQVASFASVENANIMIKRLKAKGYRAEYAKIQSRNGQSIYKVFVGRALKKEDLLKLKKELAARMDIYGFVVSHVG